MLTLVTGLPGHGKTQYTIDYVLKQVEKESKDTGTKRPVFYYGIPELKTDWTELDMGQAWTDCPDGSIVIVDECQRIFPKRPAGSKVPAHVQALETHRHRGIDLYLITQDGMLVDYNVRALTGRHFHVHRPMGMQRANVYEWPQYEGRINDDSKQIAIRSTYKYDSKIHELYKSATIHTVKRKVPYKFFLFPALGLLFVGALTALIYSLQNAGDLDRDESSSQVAIIDQPQSPNQNPFDFTSQSTNKISWEKRHQPRVPDLPHSAPIYDEVFRPVDFPRPACLSMGPRCLCYSQQATRLDISPDQCRLIIANGWFDPTYPSHTDRPKTNTTPTPADTPRRGGGGGWIASIH